MHSRWLLLVLCCALCGLSCEKPVTIDLDKTEPQIVIQGVVNDIGAPVVVVVETTRDFYVGQAYPRVSGAAIVVSDEAGWVDTLEESSTGVYTSRPVQAVAGRRYMLHAVVGGKEYSAVTTMPARVKLDSINAAPILEFNGRTGYDIDAIFRDPPAPGNRYRLEMTASGKWLEESFKWGQIILTDDKAGNGGEMAYRFRASKNIAPGETLTVNLLSLDAAAYEYFQTLNNIIVSVENPLPINPQNPVTNLSNGALGYFVAYAIDSRSVVLK